MSTNVYVLARTGSGRPSLQHRLIQGEQGEQFTACGMDTQFWSRAYQRTAITQILCKRCNRSVK